MKILRANRASRITQEENVKFSFQNSNLINLLFAYIKHSTVSFART